MYSSLCCPCGEVVLRDNGHETKIRSKVLVVKGQNTYAVCKSCNTDVLVPLVLDQGHALMKSLHSGGNPRLFIAEKDK